MRKILIRIFNYILVIAMGGILIFSIHFLFVYSYDINEERVIKEKCDAYVETINGKTLKVLNSFVYDSDKYYACLIDNLFDKLLVVDDSSRVIYKQPFAQIQPFIESLGQGTYGIYNDEIVYVVKEIGEELNIRYYSLDTKKLVFSMQGEELENGDELEDGEEVVE